MAKTINPLKTNHLFFGDNLDILREYIPDESVDLIYLDPPFNSNQEYNILFSEQNGKRSAAQMRAFSDTWRWDRGAALQFHLTVTTGDNLGIALNSIGKFIGPSDMLAYLSMMSNRLRELKRVLKPSGAIYLHCDPAASHYLKILLDALFRPVCFRNEIVWHYSGWNKKLKETFNRRHDIILYYVNKPEQHPFTPYTIPWESEEEYIKLRKQKVHQDKNGKYVLSDAGGGNRVKRYLAEAMEYGKPIDDVWNIDKLNNSSKERLGYPTQKPEALLERIIMSSSAEGGVVLDPFCGCGTTVAVAQRLGRKWIGIDVSSIATNLIKHRLYHSFSKKNIRFEVIGEPVSVTGAKDLAESDRMQFQWWALGLVGARGVQRNAGPDRGIDGRILFNDSNVLEDYKEIILSVKSGKLKATDVRDLRGTLEREDATMGALITLEKPSKQMEAEAASAGFYFSAWTNRNHPRLQIITIAELLDGGTIDYPAPSHINVTYRHFEANTRAVQSARQRREQEASQLKFSPDQALPYMLPEKQTGRDRAAAAALRTREQKKSESVRASRTTARRKTKKR